MPCLIPLAAAATIDEVTFLNKIADYETVVATTLVTQEGKRIPIERGTKLNVAGFTASEAFVVSRLDKPNGFVRKSDIAPIRDRSGVMGGTIREENIK